MCDDGPVEVKPVSIEVRGEGNQTRRRHQGRQDGHRQGNHREGSVAEKHLLGRGGVLLSVREVQTEPEVRRHERTEHNVLYGHSHVDSLEQLGALTND